MDIENMIENGFPILHIGEKVKLYELIDEFENGSKNRKKQICTEWTVVDIFNHFYVLRHPVGYKRAFHPFELKSKLKKKKFVPREERKCGDPAWVDE